MQIIDSRTREEIIQDSLNHASHVCRKHIYRDFAEQNDYIRHYDNASVARDYAILAFRKAALLNPHIRECSGF